MVRLAVDLSASTNNRNGRATMRTDAVDLSIWHMYRTRDPWPSRLAGGMEVGRPGEEPQYRLIVVVGPESVRHRAVDEGGGHLAIG